MLLRFARSKGNATEDTVRRAQVIKEDKEGERRADASADNGGLCQYELVSHAGHTCVAACNRWFQICFESHRFIIAISGAVLNEDGFGRIATKADRVSVQYQRNDHQKFFLGGDHSLRRRRWRRGSGYSGGGRTEDEVLCGVCDIGRAGWLRIIFCGRRDGRLCVERIGRDKTSAMWCE